MGTTRLTEYAVEYPQFAWLTEQLHVISHIVTKDNIS